MSANITETPVAVLRPSSSEADGADIYRVTNNLFMPSPETVQSAVVFLNDFSPSLPSRVKSIEDKRPPEFAFSRNNALYLADVEKISQEVGCNVLGGLFLNYLSTYGVETGKVLGVARIKSNDLAFMTTLYPDLVPYFSDEGSFDEVYARFARGVVYNNTGSFKVIEMGGYDTRSFSEQFLRQTAFLKRIYRYAVAKHVPWDTTGVRDNLVHTPENFAELESHLKVLRERFLK